MKTIITSILFLFQISLMAQNGMYDICPIKNSEKVPEATVYGLDGKAVNLKEFVGDKQAVIVFYRGGWCPYCMRHLSALQEAKASIDEMGYELIAIAPDDFVNLDSSKAKSNGLDYQLLSDKEANAMKAFGIAWTMDAETFAKYKEKWGIDLEFWSGEKHHMLPVPAVFVIKEGKIQFQHVDPDYSQRLSPEILISFLK